MRSWGATPMHLKGDYVTAGISLTEHRPFGASEKFM